MKVLFVIKRRVSSATYDRRKNQNDLDEIEIENKSNGRFDLRLQTMQLEAVATLEHGFGTGRGGKVTKHRGNLS